MKAEEHGEVIAALLDAQPRRGIGDLVKVELNAGCCGTWFWTELERGETCTMKNGICVDRVCLETLAN